MKAILLLSLVMPLWLLLLLLVAGPPPDVLVIDDRRGEVSRDEDRCPAGPPGVPGWASDEAPTEMRTL